jgi:hypothetical protein
MALEPAALWLTQDSGAAGDDKVAYRFAFRDDAGS